MPVKKSGSKRTGEILSRRLAVPEFRAATTNFNPCGSSCMRAEAPQAFFKRFHDRAWAAELVLFAADTKRTREYSNIGRTSRDTRPNKQEGHVIWSRAKMFDKRKAMLMDYWASQNLWESTRRACMHLSKYFAIVGTIYQARAPVNCPLHPSKTGRSTRREASYEAIFSIRRFAHSSRKCCSVGRNDSLKLLFVFTTWSSCVFRRFQKITRFFCCMSKSGWRWPADTGIFKKFLAMFGRARSFRTKLPNAAFQSGLFQHAIKDSLIG